MVLRMFLQFQLRVCVLVLVFLFPIFRSGGVRLWPPLHLYLPSPPRFPGQGMRAHEGLSTFPMGLFPGGDANLPRTTSSLFPLSLPAWSRASSLPFLLPPALGSCLSLTSHLQPLTPPTVLQVTCSAVHKAAVWTVIFQALTDISKPMYNSPAD